MVGMYPLYFLRDVWSFVLAVKTISVKIGDNSSKKCESYSQKLYIAKTLLHHHVLQEVVHLSIDLNIFLVYRAMNDKTDCNLHECA